MSKKPEINKLPESEVEIIGEIDEKALLSARSRAIAKLGENLNIPGFRKGHIPEQIIVKNIGEDKILEESAAEAMQDIYPKIIEENKINVIDHPHILFTKLAVGNPVEYKITVAVTPELKLADYKKLAQSAKEEEVKEVTDEDVAEAIENIRQQVGHAKFHEVNKDAGHDHGKIPDEYLPELTDDFVKTLGDFKDVADFKQKIRGYIETNRKIETANKLRSEILEKITEGTEGEAPRPLVDYEVDKMLAALKNDLHNAGLSYEKYLSEIKKDEDSLRNEWRESAAKKAKLQLILGRIAEAEKIELTKDELESETKRLMAMHKDVPEDRARAYVAINLTNERVAKFLEDLAKPAKKEE